MWSHYVLLHLIISSAPFVTKAYYTMVAPSVVRPNYDFLVAVTSHRATEEVQLTVRGHSPHQTIEIRQNVTVGPCETKLVSLRIGNLGSNGKYSISVKDGSSDEQTRELNYANKSHSVFVQTDRTVYRPGEVVRFRVVIVSPHLTTEFASFDAMVRDGADNAVREWKRVTADGGVFAGEFKLAAAPVLGNWTIAVYMARAQVLVKSFIVSEIEQFEFELVLDLPEFGILSQGQVAVTVTAAYPDGRSVKGEMTVLIHQKSSTEKSLQKVMNIDGKRELLFDFAEELELTKDCQIIMEIKVKEDMTNHSRKISKSISLYKLPYQMEVIKTSEVFKPGLPYNAMLKIAYLNGTNLREGDLVLVQWGYGNDTSFYSKQAIPADDGIVRLEFDAAPPDADILFITATYKELTLQFPEIRRALPSKNYLQLSLLTVTPEVGADVKIKMMSTENVTFMTLVILGRGGKLAHAETVSIDGNNELVFKATDEMSPDCSVVVYYVSPESGEMVADFINMEVRGARANFVELHVSQTRVYPGKEIIVGIKAKPGSTVYLMARPDNVDTVEKNITWDDVKTELRSYDLPKSWVTTGSSFKVFDKSGAVVILGNNGQSNRINSHRQSCEERNVSEAEQDISVLTRLQRDVKNMEIGNLAAFAFANVTVGLSGSVSLKLKVPPMNNGRWKLSGFSVSPLHGIGLTRELQQLEIFQPFTVTVDLPYRAKCGETIAIRVTVSNYVVSDINIEVTLEAQEGNDDQVRLTRHAKVESFRKSQMSFLLSPKRSGVVNIKVITWSNFASEHVRMRELLVEEEADVIRGNEFILLDFNSKKQLEFDVPIPSGSENISVFSTQDLLSVAMVNHENLLPIMCSDSADHNMLHMISAVIFSSYLEASGQSHDQMRHSMEMGYQQQLVFRQKSGSFSSFTGPREKGCVWSTALTARYFNLAAKFIFVDPNIVGKALDWIVSEQKSSSGAISESCSAMKPKSDLATTAFASLAFMNSLPHLSDGQYIAMDKAVNYVARNCCDTGDIYSLAIATYALHKAEHPLRERAFGILNSVAAVVGDKKFWPNYPHESLSIESTSYAILTLLSRNEMEASVPAVRWLLSKQGGLASTDDTHVALLALKEFMFKAGLKGSNVTVQYTADNDADGGTEKSNNSLRSETRNIHVRAEGDGFAALQLGYQYNNTMNDASTTERPGKKIELSSHLHMTSATEMVLTVCLSYLASDNHSDMAMLEVNLPSGFSVTAKSLQALHDNREIKKVEVRKGNTAVVIYFERLTTDDIVCRNISADLIHRVANQKLAAVHVYDRSSIPTDTLLYQVAPVASLCDICIGEDCNRFDECSDGNRSKFPKENAFATTTAGAKGRRSQGLVMVALLYCMLVLRARRRL